MTRHLVAGLSGLSRPPAAAGRYGLGVRLIDEGGVAAIFKAFLNIAATRDTTLTRTCFMVLPL